jgi:DNA-binding transcriptional LysR family regulator
MWGDVGMDIKQLRYFVMVAQELSFSRAATRLHMSQPPLSQQIKALEDEMGVALLVRNRREVKLTEAGTVFLRECHLVLDQLRTAINATVHASRAHVGTLRVGVATSGLFSVMPAFQELMRASFPEVDVRVSDMQSKDQVAAVLQGALDLGIVHTYPDRSGLSRCAVFTDTLCAALPARHPLASRADLTLSDLMHEPMVALFREQAPTVYDTMIATCTLAGFSPDIRHSARNAFTIFQMVQMGLGVALVPRSYHFSGYPGVVFHDLPPDEGGSIHIEAIWHPRHASQLTQTVASQLLPQLAARLLMPRPI